MTVVSTLVRLVSTAVIVYAAVWLESKWAMTIIIGGLCVCNELAGWWIRDFNRTLNAATWLSKLERK